MRKLIKGNVLLMGLILAPSITVHANSLSTIPTVEETGVPSDIYQYAEIIGNQFDICPELLMALAEKESRYTATAENGSCKGLMQVNTACHKERFTDAGWSSTEWTDAYKNMYVAADYLAELFDDYEDAGIVLGIYHGESGAVSRGKKGQLSSYVNNILKRSEELERFHGK